LAAFCTELQAICSNFTGVHGGPENQANFPIHLGLEYFANFIFMVFPRKSRIVLKFDQETDNILFAISKLA
jgi:hypothetical protein